MSTRAAFGDTSSRVLDVLASAVQGALRRVDLAGRALDLPGAGVNGLLGRLLIVTGCLRLSNPLILVLVLWWLPGVVSDGGSAGRGGINDEFHLAAANNHPKTGHDAVDGSVAAAEDIYGELLAWNVFLNNQHFSESGDVCSQLLIVFYDSGSDRR